MFKLNTGRLISLITLRTLMEYPPNFLSYFAGIQILVTIAVHDKHWRSCEIKSYISGFVTVYVFNCTR
jgi:hypothetical protein